MNQKLINDLREGRIVLKNEPKNPEAVRAITVRSFAGNGKYYFWHKEDSCFYSGGYTMPIPEGLPIIPIADFLRPEPRFKKGDLVKYKGLSKDVFRIGEIEWEGNHYRYLPENSKVGYSESSIDFAPAEAYAEQQFEIGKVYEFSDGEDLVKGKAVGTVDYEGQRNFIAEISGKLSVFESIRPIQEITKEDLASLLSDWMELSDNSILMCSTYADVHENLYHKSKSILEQLKKEGVIL